MTDAAIAKPAWPAMSIAQAHALITAPGSPLEMEEIEIRGVKTRVWKNAPASLRDVALAGRAHGDKAFLVYEDERASFEGFFRAVSALAHELQAQGVEKGDRVAVCESIFRNVDRNEDGSPAIEATPCAHPDCPVYLCQAGCEHLSFVCDACAKRYCAAHPVFTLDGERFCGECFLEMRRARLSEVDCTPEEIVAFPQEVA